MPEGGRTAGTETEMPIYEYVCTDCDNQFDKLWPTVSAAQDQQPNCPACESSATRRTMSRVAVLGELGGLTPQEESASSAESAESAKSASFTPKEQIDTLQANRQRKREQGR